MSADRVTLHRASWRASHYSVRYGTRYYGTVTKTGASWVAEWPWEPAHIISTQPTRALALSDLVQYGHTHYDENGNQS